MGKPTGFLDYARMDCPARSAEARVADWAPLDLPLSEKNRRRQSGRCMDCGVPFCQAGVTFDGALLGCPLHNLIPEWNDLLWNGRAAAPAEDQPLPGVYRPRLPGAVRKGLRLRPGLAAGDGAGK